MAAEREEGQLWAFGASLPEGRMELASVLTAAGYVPVSLVRSGSGLLEISASVAGSPAVFWLDSGAIRTCFNQASAERLGLPSAPGPERTTEGAAGGEAVPYVALPDFSVGGHGLPSVEACVVDLGPINNARQRRGDRPIDGLLGSDLLFARAAVLDYGTLTLYLRQAAEAARGPGLAALFASEGRRVIPLARSKAGLLDLSARFGEVAAIFSLDTGAQRTCLDRAAVERLALPTRASDRRALGIAVASDPVSNAVVQDLWMGPCKVPAVEVVVVDFGQVNQYRQEQGDAPLDGVLGAEIMTAWAAVLDYGALRLYVQEGKPAAEGT